MREITIPECDLPKSYRYQLRVCDRCGNWLWSYEIVGQHGSMHLHISEYGSGDKKSESAGLETHYRKPPKYMANTPPSHDECFLNKGICWHDGTSLYATEFYLPMHQRGMVRAIFNSMVNDAESKFAEFKSEAVEEDEGNGG